MIDSEIEVCMKYKLPASVGFFSGVLSSFDLNGNLDISISAYEMPSKIKTVNEILEEDLLKLTKDYEKSTQRIMSEICE